MIPLLTPRPPWPADQCAASYGHHGRLLLTAPRRAVLNEKTQCLETEGKEYWVVQFRALTTRSLHRFEIAEPVQADGRISRRCHIRNRNA